jgi:exonuclease III
MLSLSRIIFWNVNKKDLTNFVCAIAKSTNSDVVVLNENNVPSEETLRALQKNVSQDFYYPTTFSSLKERFHCFCRSPKLDLSETHSGPRVSVRKIQLGRHKALLVLVHGIDIRNNDPEIRQSFAQSLATEIEFVKQEKNINKLILLGDFNMNPYEKGMNLAEGLNSMMTKSCIERGTRRYQNKDYDFYYNPMWSLFGDNTHGPAGTIYSTSNQGAYGWSMLDQVLIHHSIVELFYGVKILTEAGTESLMTKKGRPDAGRASDHFPILVDFCGGKDE